MAPVILGLAAVGFIVTLLGGMVFTVVGPGSRSWFYRSWKLGRSPSQWWLMVVFSLTALAFGLLAVESKNAWLLVITALAVLMTITVAGGKGSRLALWTAAALVLSVALAGWAWKHVVV